MARRSFARLALQAAISSGDSNSAEVSLIARAVYTCCEHAAICSEPVRFAANVLSDRQVSQRHRRVENFLVDHHAPQCRAISQLLSQIAEPHLLRRLNTLPQRHQRHPATSQVTTSNALIRRPLGLLLSGSLLGRFAGPVAACFGLSLTLLGELRFAFPHQARLITRSSLGFQLAGTCFIGHRPSRHAHSPASHSRRSWRCLP